MPSLERKRLGALDCFRILDTSQSPSSMRSLASPQESVAPPIR